jgi:hypothetical protein
MRTRLLILALLIATPTLARSRPPLRHQRHQSAKPAPGPNLAQVYANGTTHGLVFKSISALAVFWNDSISVGQPTPFQTYLDAGDVVMVPNGTRLEILSPSVQSVPGTAARYVRVRLTTGYWKEKCGYVMWSDLAALPAQSKPAATVPHHH